MNKDEIMTSIDLDRLKNDEYYLMCKMMISSLKTDDVIDGLNQSLFFLKIFLNSGNVILHRKKEGESKYSVETEDSSMTDSVRFVNHIVNKTSSIIENKGNFFLELGLSEEFNNMLFLYISATDLDSEYILSVNNLSDSKKVSDDFWKDIHDSMLVTLKRAESYEKNIRAINEDMLTGLDNRNSYEKRINNIDSEESKLVYVLFDLFRLKYVNDNFSHSVGDRYISEVSKILAKYWPKYAIETVNGFEKKVNTGHCVYRIGGDEFALLTSRENSAMSKIKAQLAAEEVTLIDLDVDEDLPVGLNFGIAEYDGTESIKDVYIKADSEMLENKQKMYVSTGLDRRKG